jgi:tetratricopeptide (TPR) repeat protein
MTVKNYQMKNKLIAALLFMACAIGLNGQITFPPDGNKKASVSEYVGITEIMINYSRPAVKGREGQIWGKLVHYGFADLGYGTSKAAPWRAGANENTTIQFSTDVLIEDKMLPKGKYAFFIAMGEEKATLVFSKFNNAWGSFYYKEENDALRVEVPVVKVEKSIERLKYEFTNQTENSAVVSMQWEQVKVPFTVSVNLQKTLVDAFRNEVDSGIFYRYWQNLQMAADYCLTHNINLEEGLNWADRSINSYFGESNFKTLSTYAGLLQKLNRSIEADSIMKKAIPMGNSQDLATYGIRLNKMDLHNEAFKIFKHNYDKNPNDVYSHLGMVSGHFYLGEKEKALGFCESAKKSTTDKLFLSYIDNLKADIKAGKDIFK